MRRIRKLPIEERKKELEIKLKEITNMIAEFQVQIESSEGRQALNLIMLDDKLSREFLEEMYRIKAITSNISTQMTRQQYR